MIYNHFCIFDHLAPALRHVCRGATMHRQALMYKSLRPGGSRAPRTCVGPTRSRDALRTFSSTVSEFISDLLMIYNRFLRFDDLAPALRHVCRGATSAPMHRQASMYKDGALGHRDGHRGGHGGGRMEFEGLQVRLRNSYTICL